MGLENYGADSTLPPALNALIPLIGLKGVRVKVYNSDEQGGYKGKLLLITYLYKTTKGVLQFYK